MGKLTEAQIDYGVRVLAKIKWDGCNPPRMRVPVPISPFRPPAPRDWNTPVSPTMKVMEFTTRAATVGAGPDAEVVTVLLCNGVVVDPVLRAALQESNNAA